MSNFEMLSFLSSTEDFINAPEHEVVDFCARLPSPKGQDARTKKISDNVIAKIRIGMKNYEYQNQMHVWTLLNRSQIRVPRPLRFFEAVHSDGVTHGYLLMEYLAGQSLSKDGLCRRRDIIDKVIDAVRSLQKVSTGTGCHPGAIAGPSMGFPWGEGTKETFPSIEALEKTLQYRLSHGSKPVKPWDFADCSLALCHLDLAPRNIILLDDGSIGLLDWSTMAYYPAIFEVASLSFLQYLADIDDQVYYESLIHGLRTDTHKSEMVNKQLQRLHTLSIKYSL